MNTVKTHIWKKLLLGIFGLWLITIVLISTHLEVVNPSIQIYPRVAQNSNEVGYIRHPIGQNVTVGGTISGSYQSTTARDFNKHIIAAEYSQTIDRYYQTATVRYNFPVMSKITSLRIAAKFVEYLNGIPTGSIRTITVQLYNLANTRTYSVSITTPNESRGFDEDPLVNGSYVIITATRNWGLTNPGYTMELEIDLLEFEVWEPNQSPIVTDPPQIQYVDSAFLTWTNFNVIDFENQPIAKNVTWYYTRNGIEYLYPIQNQTIPWVHLQIGDQIYVKAIASDSMGYSTPVVISNRIYIQNIAPVLSNVLIQSSEADSNCVFTDSTIFATATPSDLNYDQTPMLSISFSVNSFLIQNRSSESVLRLAPLNISVGDNITVWIESFDGMVYGEPVMKTFIVQNRVPSFAGPIMISPSIPKTTDDLIAFHNPFSDPENHSFSVIYNWYKIIGTGVANLIQSNSNGTLDAIWTSAGDRIYVEVYAEDFFNSSQISIPKISPIVEIENTNPILSSKQLMILAPNGSIISQNQPIFSSSHFQVNASICDPDLPQYLNAQIKWVVNDLVVEQISLPINSEGFVYHVYNGTLKAGDRIYCQISTYDGDAIGESWSSSVYRIENQLPQIQNITLTGLSKLQSTVAIVEFSDLDQHQIVLFYEWRLNNVTQNISGSIFPSSLYRRGDQLQVKVIIADIFGGTFNYGQDMYSAIYTIKNCVPNIQSVEVIHQGSAFDEIRLQPMIFDPDLDPTAVDVIWLINDEILENNSALVLSPEYFSRGDKIDAYLLPFDKYDHQYGPIFTIKPIIIQNAVPTIDSIYISPGLTAFEDEEILFSINGSDRDGDAITYQYSWKIADRTLNYTQISPIGAFLAGDVITITITPYDGIDYGESFIVEITIISGSRSKLFSLDMMEHFPVGAGFYLVMIFGLALTAGFIGRTYKRKVYLE
jgi:hypothetical protein